MKPESVSSLLSDYKKYHDITYPPLKNIGGNLGKRKAKHKYLVGQMVKAKYKGQIVVGEILPETKGYTNVVILKLDASKCDKQLFNDTLGVVPISRREVLEVLS